MLPRFWVASTEPERALGRGKACQPWRGRGWPLAMRDRGPEAGVHCLEGHLIALAPSLPAAAGSAPRFDVGGHEPALPGRVLVRIDQSQQVLEVVLRLDVRRVDLDRAVEVVQRLL